MSDRSADLRRQRDLLREQLAQVEQQLAAEESALHGLQHNFEAKGALPSVQEPTEAEAILAQYRQPSASISRRTQLGCVLYVGVLLGVIFLGLAVFYALEHAGRSR